MGRLRIEDDVRNQHEEQTTRISVREKET